MTKAEILRKHKMTEQEFYQRFPTQEHYTKEFGNGGTTKRDKELEDKQLGLQLQNRTGSSSDSNPSLSRNTVSLEATPEGVKNFTNTTRVGQSKYKDGTKPFISGEAAYTLPMKTNNLTSALEFNAGVNYDNGINASAGVKPYLNYEFKNKSNPFKRNFSVEGGIDAKVFTPTLTNDPKYKDADGMKKNPAQVNSFVKGYYNKNKKGFTANAGLERSLIDNSNYASAGIGYNFGEGGILKNAPSRTTPEISRLANGGYIKKFVVGGTFDPYSSNLSGASSAPPMPDAQPAAINMTGENAASTVAAPTDPTGKEVTGLQSPYKTNNSNDPNKKPTIISDTSGGPSGGRQSQLTGDPTTDYYLKAADRYHNRWNKAAKIGITAAGLTADALGAAGAGSAIAGGINKTFGFGGGLTPGMLKGNDFNINPPKDLNLSAPKNLNLPTPGNINLGTPGKIPVPFSGGSSPMPTGSRPMIMANGGPVPMNVVNADNKPQLTRYSGLKHSQGGIALGNTGNEVETLETRFGDDIFSHKLKYDPKLFSKDSIKNPGLPTYKEYSKLKSFADMSKIIDNKYSKRDNDKPTNDGKKRELDSLFAKQESLKPNQGQTQFAKGGKMFAGGGKYDVPNPPKQSMLDWKTPNYYYEGKNEGSTNPRLPYDNSGYQMTDNNDIYFHRSIEALDNTNDGPRANNEPYTPLPQPKAGVYTTQQKGNSNTPNPIMLNNAPIKPEEYNFMNENQNSSVSAIPQENAPANYRNFGQEKKDEFASLKNKYDKQNIEFNPIAPRNTINGLEIGDRSDWRKATDWKNNLALKAPQLNDYTKTSRNFGNNRNQNKVDLTRGNSLGFDKPLLNQTPGAFDIDAPTSDLQAERLIGKNKYKYPSSKSGNKNLDLSLLNPAAQLALTALGNNDPLAVKNYQLKNPALLDSTQAKRENRDIFSAIKSDARTGGGSGGGYMAFALNAAAQEADKNSQIDSAYTTTNSQILNNWAEKNNITNKEVQELNAREIDASKTAKQFRNQNMAGILGQMGQDRLGELKVLNPDYEWTRDKFGRKVSQRRIPGTESVVPNYASQSPFNNKDNTTTNTTTTTIGENPPTKTTNATNPPEVAASTTTTTTGGTKKKNPPKKGKKTK